MSDIQDIARLPLCVGHHFDEVIAVRREAEGVGGGDGVDGVVVGHGGWM